MRVGIVGGGKGGVCGEERTALWGVGSRCILWGCLFDEIKLFSCLVCVNYIIDGG